MIFKYKMANVGNRFKENWVDQYLDCLVNTFAIARIVVKNCDVDDPPNR